jgi:voltage-gated potassium channel
MKSFLYRYRSELLMFALIGQILASPFADDHPHVGGLLALVVLVLVLVFASYTARKRFARLLIAPLTLVWIVARSLEALETSSPLYPHIAPVAGLALSLAILSVMMERFGSVSEITSSMISEAFISYLIIAIAFSQLYAILNRLLDTPFNQVILASKTSTLIYFSMITLSSVGYGGIVPVNPYVRLIAALESMIGIFYIAVVVARLVSSYRSERTKVHPAA